MQKNPKVSIIMPTYNRPKTLKRAIDSCLNQTYKNIEIVIVNDNNKGTEAYNKTQRIIKKYGKSKKIVYFELNENLGACKARNKGINISNGEYITFLDDDDEYFPEYIEKSINYMIKNNYEVIFGDLTLIDDNTGYKKIIKYKKNFELNKEGLLKKHLLEIISGGITFIYKKEVLNKIGGFYDIPASQEYILMLYTILGGYKIGYFEFSGAIGHIVNSDSKITGSQKAIDAKKEVLKLIKPHLHFLKINDRRKVVFRIYLFMFINYYKIKNIKFFYYGIKLFIYFDLLILKFFKKEEQKPEGNILYK